MLTKQQKNRRYKLHYQLRKRGNTVKARKKEVYKRANEVSAT